MELALIISAIGLGFASGFHCIGMCGPIALSMGLTKNLKANFYLQNLTYQLGRILTYSILGGILGIIGQSFELASNERFWRMVNADGTSVTIDKKNVTWEVPETFLLKCKDMIVEARNSIKTKTNTHESISQEYSLSTNSYNTPICR